MKLYTLSIIFSLLFMSVSISCNKNSNPEPGEIEAVLTDYTGLDGCSWVIELENGEIKEPFNLKEFEIELEEGKKVWVEYTVLDNAISICMVGEVVRVENIRKR